MHRPEQLVLRVVTESRRVEPDNPEDFGQGVGANRASRFGWITS